MRLIAQDHRFGPGERPAATGAARCTLVRPQRPDPPWARFSVHPRSGLMTGIHLDACNGAVPRATPFRMRFRDAETAQRQSIGFAMLILGMLSGEEVRIEGAGAAAPSDDQATVDAWNAFLQGGACEPRPPPEARHLEIAREEYERRLAGARHVATTRTGALTVETGGHLLIGRPLSGFAALDAFDGPACPQDHGLPAERLDVAAARQALDAVAQPSSAAVSWYGLAAGDAKRLRLQAAGAMPVLAGYIAESLELARAVDEMKPLHPLLQTRTGLAKAGLRRLGRLRRRPPEGGIFDEAAPAEGADPDAAAMAMRGAEHALRGVDALGVNRAHRFRLDGALSLEKAMRSLAELPADRVPATDADWTAFLGVFSGCAVPLSNALGIPLRRILEASKGDWSGFADTLAGAADFAAEAFDRRAMALTAIDSIEAVEGFARTVVLPQALASILDAEQPLPPVSGEFFEAAFALSAGVAVGAAGNVAAQMFATARRFAGRIAAMMEIEGRAVDEEPERPADAVAYPDGGFPTLTGEWTAPNGVVAAPLRGARDLAEEGRAMRHCIGTYLNRARATLCHLYSLRGCDGGRLSTLEISAMSGDTPAEAAAGFEIVQNKAHRNGRPDAAARIAADAFLDALRDGEAPIRFDEIAEWRDQLLREAGRGGGAPEVTWSSALEFDWTDAGKRQALWEEWRAVIGGRIAKSPNPGAIYRLPAARALVAAMSPKAAGILAKREAAQPPSSLDRAAHRD